MSYAKEIDSAIREAARTDAAPYNSDEQKHHSYRRESDCRPRPQLCGTPNTPVLCPTPKRQKSRDTGGVRRTDSRFVPTMNPFTNAHFCNIQNVLPKGRKQVLVPDILGQRLESFSLQLTLGNPLSGQRGLVIPHNKNLDRVIGSVSASEPVIIPTCDKGR